MLAGDCDSSGKAHAPAAGREVLYALDARRLHEARAFLDAVSAGWDRALARLRGLVET